MAVRSFEEITAAMSEILRDRTDDTALSFIEDVTDTIRSHTEKEGEDWERKYRENDESWRKRYRDRFFGDTTESPVLPEVEEKEDEPEENYTIAGLFEE